MLPAGHADGCADEGAQGVGVVIVPGREPFRAGQEELAPGDVAVVRHGRPGLVDDRAAGRPRGLDGVLDQMLRDGVRYPQADGHSVGAEAVLEAEVRLAEQQPLPCGSQQSDQVVPECFGTGHARGRRGEDLDTSRTAGEAAMPEPGDTNPDEDGEKLRAQVCGEQPPDVSLNPVEDLPEDGLGI